MIRAVAGVVVAATICGVAAIAVLGGSLGASGSQAGASLTALLTQAGDACVVGGSVQTLDAEQSAMAEQIVSASFADSGEDLTVARVALMVAGAESGLQNLGPRPGNAGSLGLFQQRASQGWGTPAQETNPAEATGMFVHRLLAVPGWRDMAPWVAAQTVQASAFTGLPTTANGGSEAVGGNYEAKWPLSGVWLSAVIANGNHPGACGQGVPAGEAGPASAHGLPSGYSIPAGTGPAHAAALSFALSQLGKPYVWAAAGPAAYDCSGLTMAAWAASHVELGHYTVTQQHEGSPVAAAVLMPGDLVLTPGSDSPGPGLAGHVGIYLGDGLVESAIDPQMGVAVQSWQAFVSGGIDGLVDPDPTDG